MKRYVIGVLIFVLVFASMCEEKETEITKENIGEKVAEAYKDVETYSMNTEMTVTVTGNVDGEEKTITVINKQESVYDRKNSRQKHHSKVTMSGEGMNYTVEEEIYLFGKTLYIKILGDWYKKELEEPPELDDVRSFRELFSNSEISEMKVVTYGGEKVYYVTLTPTLSKMVETFEKTQKLYRELGIGNEMTLGDLEESVEDFKIHYWISKKDLLIVKMQIELNQRYSEEIEGKGHTEIVTLITDYNKYPDIKLPEDAKYAEDWDKSPFAQYKKTEEEIEKLNTGIRITNITNDDKTFYITVENGTLYEISSDDGNKVLDVDEDSRKSEMHVTIMDDYGKTIVDYIVDNKGSYAKFTEEPILPYAEEQIEITVSEIKPGVTYRIIIEAAEEKTEEIYTAI